MNLTKNEIIALRHLSDEMQHDDYPEGISKAQYTVAIQSLKEKGLVYAAFIEGGELYAAQITIQGIAELDNLNDANTSNNDFREMTPCEISQWNMEFIKEPLFRAMTNESYGTPISHMSSSQAWKEAKDLCLELGTNEYPEALIVMKHEEMVLKYSIFNKYGTNSYGETNAHYAAREVLFFCNLMIKTSLPNDKLKETLKLMTKFWGKWEDNLSKKEKKILNAFIKELDKKDTMYYNYLNPTVQSNVDDSHSVENDMADFCSTEEDDEILEPQSSIMLRVRIEAILGMMNIKDIDTLPNKRAFSRYLALLMNEDAKTIYTTLNRRIKGKLMMLNKTTHGEDIEKYNKALEDCKINEIEKFKIHI